MYEPTITTHDLWQGLEQEVGSVKHCHLIDLVDAIQSPEDEELLVLLHGGHNRAGHTEQEVGVILGIPEQAVQQQFRRILARARSGSMARARRAGRGHDHQ